jgi:alpha-tubulin suppressor-like RCC1 family protein
MTFSPGTGGTPGAAGGAIATGGAIASSGTGGIGDSGGSAGAAGSGGAATGLALGAFHTCVVFDTGSVRCFGNARYLGYASTNNVGDDETPASAGDVDVGGFVTQVDAGWYHSCAVLSAGNVRCWGEAAQGQLGYGDISTIGDDESPAAAGNVRVGGRVTQVSAGASHSCARLAIGNVRCWGSNEHWQLGYPSPDNIGDNENPASAGNVDVGGFVVQVAAGRSHTCALLDTGNVRCWGRGGNGALGYGNTNTIGDDESPASAGDVEVGGRVVRIGVGVHHTCALLDNGKVRCWGDAAVGQLGYGNTNRIGDNETPASAGDVDVGGTVSDLAVGDWCACVLLTDGKVRCWGDGTEGSLGYGNTDNIGDNETPTSAGDVDVGGAVIHIAKGFMHTCAVLDNRSLRCWGRGRQGELGYGNINDIGDDESPASAGDVEIQ